MSSRVSPLLAGLLTLIAAAVPAAAPAAPYEPNDNVAQAIPVRGGSTYVAATETINDEDWFVFYTRGQAQLDVAFTNTATRCSLQSEVRDEKGNRPAHFKITGSNITDRFVFTSPRATKYFFQAVPYSSGDYCIGATYQFVIEPAGALTTAGCFAALKNRDRWAGAVRRTKRQLKRARIRNARGSSRRLTRRLRSHERQLRRARNAVRQGCGG